MPELTSSVRDGPRKSVMSNAGKYRRFKPAVKLCEHPGHVLDGWPLQPIDFLLERQLTTR
jgi:hypothetical protein